MLQGNKKHKTVCPKYLETERSKQPFDGREKFSLRRILYVERAVMSHSLHKNIYENMKWTADVECNIETICRTSSCCHSWVSRKRRSTYS